MNADKQLIIDGILERLNASPFVIVTEYAGITVKQFSELRRRLGDTGARCEVAKNSFVKRALHAVNAPSEIDATLKGQNAIVTGDSDICAAAKVLRDFAKEFSKGAVRSGLLDGVFLSADEVRGLADLPPRPVLLAQFLGVLQAPGSKLVRTINEPGTALARVLKAKAEKEAA
ncbi:MAG: 50S ribosomal protein L10 [Verrucomicrobia bacterium]|jgi:large subunit ribosomal protein L10|nr:50S ribosomal protein L10 [Verrucomicrobiota bacterium]